MAEGWLSDGVWGVVATPFVSGGSAVDRVSLVRLVRHYARCGVAGLTILGVFGEAASLTTAERRQVLETVRDEVGLPLVAGVTGLSTAPVVEEIESIHEILGRRLAGAMVQVNSPCPDVVAAHLNAVHEATGAGLVVQDYPVASGVTITAQALVDALGASIDGVAAVKAEAPPTPVALHAITTSLAGIPVFGGLGGLSLLDELAAGAAGAMTGFSYPEALVAVTDAWRTGGYHAARRALLPYLPLVNFEQQAGIALSIRKRALCQRGLIVDSAVRPPASDMPPAMADQLVRHVEAVEAAVRH